MGSDWFGVIAWKEKAVAKRTATGFMPLMVTPGGTIAPPLDVIFIDRPARR
jgi:hypothetical protein